MTTRAPYRPLDELLAAGTELGRHRVVGKLSEGAHAVLYIGEHVQTRAEVALKVLRAAYIHSPEMLARFDREAIVMGRLAGCRTVVQVHDAGTLDDGRRYLVMEFVRGRELATMLTNSQRREVPLELERVLAIAGDIAAALRDAHGKQVVHRDLKPSNVMIVREPDGRETAKLVDFGISGDCAQVAGTGDLTMTGSVIGTPEYMSPEQAVGLPAAPSMDLFALGVLMFEMVTGALPPPAALRGGTVPPASSLRAGVPAALDQLIRELLSTDPARRPEDAIAVLTRLSGLREQLHGSSGPNAFAEGRPVRAAGAIELGGGAEVVQLHRHRSASTEASSEHGVRPRVPSTRRRIVIAAVVCTVALVLGIAAVWLLHDGGAAQLHATETSSSEPEPTAAAAAVVETPTPIEPLPLPVIPPPVVEPAAAPSEPAPGEPAPVEPVASPSGPSRKPPSAAKPSTPAGQHPASVAKASSDAACVELRAQAQRASDALKWNQVLEHTRDATCWSDPRARGRMRVEALAELGKFESCAREGGKSSDPVIRKIVELCTKRIDAG